MTLSELVTQKLEEHEQARNSDKALLAYILQSKGVSLTKSQIDVILSVNFESIRRTRQKLNEQGKFLPTDPKVLKQRQRKAQETQQRITTTKPENISTLIEEVPKATYVPLDY